MKVLFLILLMLSLVVGWLLYAYHQLCFLGFSIIVNQFLCIGLSVPNIIGRKVFSNIALLLGRKPHEVFGKKEF